MHDAAPSPLSRVPDADLASATGVTREAVRLWKKGQRRMRISHAQAIEAAFGIPFRDLRPDLAAAFAPAQRETA